MLRNLKCGAGERKPRMNFLFINFMLLIIEKTNWMNGGGWMGDYRSPERTRWEETEWNNHNFEQYFIKTLTWHAMRSKKKGACLSAPLLPVTLKHTVQCSWIWLSFVLFPKSKSALPVDEFAYMNDHHHQSVQCSTAHVRDSRSDPTRPV